jgi:arginine/ornithine permease
MNGVNSKKNEPIQSVLNKSEGLQRGMKSRHVLMIAVGGTIGTGLFLGSGYVLQEAGPGGSLVAYIIGGLLMYIMMMCLGELVVAMPVAGSTQAYANEFMSPVVGFMSGWIRWIACAVTITSQLVATSIIMKNIIPSVPSYVWIIAFTLLLFILNLFPSKVYGESEFWFAGIKIITIIVFGLTALALLTGILGNGTGSFHKLSEGQWFPSNIKSILLTIMAASFAYGGVDLVASAAGESEDPEKNLPRAIYRVIFGLILIYLLSLLLLSFILPWQDANLKGSPFAYVFRKAGLSSAELIINAVVVTSALSSANTFIYSCTRSLWSLGKHGHAGKFLGKVNKRKVPVNALLISMAFSAVALICSFVSPDRVYLFLISSIGASNMLLYSITCLSQLRFRKMYVEAGNKIQDLKFRAPFYPVLPICGIVFYILLLVMMFFDPTQRLALYTGAPVYIILYILYKLFYGK